MKNVKTVINWLKSQTSEVHKHGIIHRGFYPTERDIIDFAPDFKGWTQYDTDQDAHYFGCWVNKVKLLVLTYAEGDWTLMECETVERFNAQITSMNEFYNEGFECIAIGKTEITVCRQDRTKFLIKTNNVSSAQHA